MPIWGLVQGYLSRVNKLPVALHCTGKNLALSKPTGDEVRHTHLCIHVYVPKSTGIAGAGFIPEICPAKNIIIDWHCMRQDWRITNLHICPAWVLWSVPVYVDIVLNMRSHDLVASFQYYKCKGLGMRLQSFVYWRRDEGSLGIWLVAHIVCKVCNAVGKSFRVGLQSPRWIPLMSHPTVLNNNIASHNVSTGGDSLDSHAQTPFRKGSGLASYPGRSKNIFWAAWYEARSGHETTYNFHRENFHHCQ